MRASPLSLAEAEAAPGSLEHGDRVILPDGSTARFVDMRKRSAPPPLEDLCADEWELERRHRETRREWSEGHLVRWDEVADLRERVFSDDTSVSCQAAVYLRYVDGWRPCLAHAKSDAEFCAVHEAVFEGRTIQRRRPRRSRRRATRDIPDTPEKFWYSERFGEAKR